MAAIGQADDTFLDLPLEEEELRKAQNQILRDFILTRQTSQTRGEGIRGTV